MALSALRRSSFASLPRAPALLLPRMSRWEYRCFVPRTRGLTAAALDAAQLSREAGPERRADDYLATDANHGLKRRGGAANCAQLELKTCTRRLPDGCQQLSRSVIERHHSDGWRDASGPLEPALAAAVDVAVKQPALRVEKQRWAATSKQRGVGVEVTKLNLPNGDRWLTLCCEGSDAAAACAAGAALQRAALGAAGVPPEAARVCSYAAWVCEQRTQQTASA